MSVLDWRPDDLAAAADEIVVARNSLVGIDADLGSSRPPREWEGQASVEASAAFRRIDDGYLDHIAEMTTVITALDDAARTIDVAQNEITALIGQIEALGIAVTIVGDTVTTAPFSLGVNPAEAEGLRGEIIAAITAARGADAALASALNSVAGGAVDTHVGSAREAALPSDLQGLGTTQIVELALTDPDAVNGFTGFLTPEQRRAIANALADANAAVAGAAEGESHTEAFAAEVADVARATELLAGDSVIAAGILRALGPAGFVAAQLAIRPAATSVDASDPEALRANQRSLQKVLDMGTRDVDVSGSPDSPDSVDPAWVAGLADALDLQYYGDAPGPTGHQAIASLLAGGGVTSSVLLAEVAGAIVEKASEGEGWVPGYYGDSVGHTWLADPVTPILTGLASDPAAASAFLGSASTVAIEYLEGRDPAGLEAIRAAAAQHTRQRE